MSKKYCMDCGHYIPGGGEHNCSGSVKGYGSHVCALKEACDLFIEKEEKEKIMFEKLQMRKPRKRKTY